MVLRRRRKLAEYGEVEEVWTHSRHLSGQDLLRVWESLGIEGDPYVLVSLGAGSQPCSASPETKSVIKTGLHPAKPLGKTWETSLIMGAKRKS